MHSINNQNVYPLLNPLDLTCQSVKQEHIQRIVLLSYSSLTLENSDKIPFKIGNSGELILANLNYQSLFQHDDGQLATKKTFDIPITNESEKLLNKTIKDLKTEMANNSIMEHNIRNTINEYIEFISHFKKQRVRWRLYQSHISKSLYQYSNFPKLSQSYLSRLEKLNLTYRSAQNVISYLKLWLKNSEELFDSYVKKFPGAELDILSLDSDNLSKFHNFILDHMSLITDYNKNMVNEKINHNLQRKRRTVFSKAAFQKLHSIFKINQFPRNEDIQALADNFNINHESIMQWFSNQRRKRCKS